MWPSGGFLHEWRFPREIFVLGHLSWQYDLLSLNVKSPAMQGQILLGISHSQRFISIIQYIIPSFYRALLIQKLRPQWKSAKILAREREELEGFWKQFWNQHKQISKMESYYLKFETPNNRPLRITFRIRFLDHELKRPDSNEPILYLSNCYSNKILIKESEWYFKQKFMKTRCCLEKPQCIRV